MPRNEANEERRRRAAPTTTAQALGSLIKSARDIMRKDKGLNGDLDRLPLLTWIMFLKFLDDLEQQREEEAALAGKKFRPAIEPPYRWRDWAAERAGHHRRRTARLHQPGRSRRCRTARRARACSPICARSTSSNGDDRRDVIATVFRGVDNRMKSGYLLRDIINKVNGIHFTSQRRNPHARRALRIHAPRNARRGGRFRRVLHARAPSCASWSR